MKKLIKTLAGLCLMLSITSTNTYAGVITEILSTDYQEEKDGFRIYPQNLSTGIFITSTSRISQGDYASFFWEFDRSSLESISFNMTLLGSDSNFSLASFFVGEQTLWSHSESVSVLTQSTLVTIDLSQNDFSSLSSNTVKLGFKLASQIYGDDVLVGRDKSSLQLSDIKLTRTQVPEPSSIILFLLALGFISRKKLIK